MYLITSTREYVLFPITGPGGDLTGFPVDVAMVPEGSPAPAGADAAWSQFTGQWINGEAGFLYDEGDLPDGDYLLFGRVTNGAERAVVQSGRVRIGAGV